MRDFLHRVFLPLTLPLISAVGIALITINMSRVLLAVPKHTAAIIALCVAAGVLFGCTFFSATGKPGAVLNVAAPVGFVFLMALSGVVALSSQHPKHKAEGPGAAVPADSKVAVEAKDTNFVNKNLAASGTNIEIDYKNDDTLEHTFVLDGVAGFKLDNAKGGGAVVRGVVKNLAPGTYTFFCDISGHRQAGMEGKLIVTAAGGPGNGPAAAPAAGGNATSSIQTTVLDALKFDPNSFTVPAGTVNVTLASKAQSEHTFTLEGVAAFKELVVAKAGATAKGSVKLAKGSYIFYCSIPGHRQAGMTGTITVT